MKRKAGDEDHARPKRGRLDTSDDYPDIVDQDDANDSDYSDHDNASSSANTAHTPLTPMSGMSPSKPRFPSDLKTIRCTWPGCEKAFNRPARLTAHLRSHTNERPFKCAEPGCDKAYIEEKHLKQHTKSVHSTERQYTCQQPGCGKSFLTSTRLNRHQLVHEGQERFRCRDFPPCSESFRKHTTLQRHIRAAHLNAPAFQCTLDDCKAGFDTANSLKRHIEREHGDKKFYCEDCSQGTGADASGAQVGFPTLELLQHHVRKAHISCTFCDRSFSTRDEMEGHIEAEHSKHTLDDRKKFTCTWEACGKSFVKQSNLAAHVRSVHEGVRFVCGRVDVSGVEDLADWPLSDGCGDSFTTKGNLEKHIRHVHKRIPRPLSDKPEKRLPQDALGQLTGTSDVARRTIPCSWQGCSHKFAQLADMQDHLQTHFEQTLGSDLAEDFAMPTISESGMIDFSLPSPFGSHPVTPGLGEEWGYAPVEEGFPVPEYFPVAEREWMHDEAEMRQLIGPGELDGFIDPALR
ncbi:uncharacterized protein JN550_000124 [Neoarthrinium moseri]|uniref:uncharacterized protein n=1 Tax=Neoarthrinium moseri TaxID=1658444 RepID=UPI001FDD0C4D|nr:uncharacterized protein JN550_000124 [Neoarthrinium moseri]KAI1877942.1 hypothetical protein JN550_000124 [Neoarthrinium moseri]